MLGEDFVSLFLKSESRELVRKKKERRERERETWILGSRWDFAKKKWKVEREKIEE